MTTGLDSHTRGGGGDKPRLSASGILPFQDNKPQGAADFYFAINATFRFLISRFGEEGWAGYVREMAADYHRPVWERWIAGGLEAVQAYLQRSFEVEPGAVFEVRRDLDTVQIDVRVCPAIRHLRAAGREIVPQFCRHCFHQFDEMANLAGLAMRLEGGNGSCRQTFSRAPRPPQNVDDISSCEVP